MKSSVYTPIAVSRIYKAFTLTELMIVVAIFAVILAVSMPAITSISKGTALTTTSQAIMDQFDLARQTALSRNVSVEVRFYKIPIENSPVSSDHLVYRGMQLFVHNDSGASPLTKPMYFKSGIVIIEDSTVSSILGEKIESAPSNGDPSLGEYFKNYLYRSFRFKPSGGTDLPDTKSMHLTFKNQNDSLINDGLPANYITVQVDSVTGRVRSFRP